MDREIKDNFIRLWRKYFGNAEFPVTFYYSDKACGIELLKPGSSDHCVIGALTEVGIGRSLRFDTNSTGSFGGRKYFAFTEKIRSDFEYLLPCGIPDAGISTIDGPRLRRGYNIYTAYCVSLIDFG